MAELKGTNVAAGIVPFTDLDKYPTHYAKYGKGGYMSVETIEERDKIPAERKEEGMICYVTTDPSGAHTYQLRSGKWEIINIGASGIPIYDREELDKLGNSASSKHIYITTPNDLSGEVINNTYTTSQNGTYLDILFSTIRQLQVEVARMRNAFKYGMYSYTGSETAMSNVVGEIEEPEEEPLWAVEPDMLSLITGADVVISENFNNLKPSYQVGYNKADFLELTGTVKWWDNEDLVKNVEDSKIFIYLTTSNLNISLKLQSLIDTEKTLYIPLEQYAQEVLRLNKYNVLVIISRRSDTLGGKNFVWVSIGNPETNTTLKEGYYDMDNFKIMDYIKEVDHSYYPTEIELSDMCLYQLDVYSKYQEFTHDVLPSKPNDQDYKYRVAHITIRSVRDTTELDSIRTQLPNNELIFEEATGRLWIKNNNKLVTIVGSGGNSGGEEDDDSDMTDQQLIEKLKELGIVYETTTDGESSLQLSSISDVTFIHQATGKQFKFEVNAEGSLVSSEIPSKTLEKRIAALSKSQYAISETNQYRGFVAKLHCSENSTSPINTNDVKLNSDRVKIGAVYMPLTTDTVFGCSHAYVELENTSDKDFPLNGCYLHFLHPDNSNNPKVEHLALEGILPAGSTFLIRGKKYSDASTSSSTFISVDTYDMEWYVGSELIDFSVRRNGTTKMPYGFALTYGQPELSHETALRVDNHDTETNSKAPNLHPYFYIDSLPIDAHTSTNKLWGPSVAEAKSNTIIKNTFELDPAKQAFQALNTYDSSRYRLEKINNDIQYLNLSKATISFPHSEEEFPISNYTPKSSKEKKNVSNDKTKE